MGLVILMLLINFAISWWNCYSVGRVWDETRALGGFLRILAWCGAIQAAIGFSSVLLALLGGVAYALGYLSPSVVQKMASLWYLLIIIPALSTGLIITIESWVVMLRDRSWQSAGVTAYNTFAQVSNIWSAVKSVPSAWEDVASLFGMFGNWDDDEDGAPVGALAGLAIGLVVLSLAGGVLMASGLIKHYANAARLPSPRFAA